MLKLSFKSYFFVILLISFSCRESEQRSNKDEVRKIFQPLSSDQSHIDFANHIAEDSLINYFTYPYLYMGGGVAVGDLNNDGYSDIFFTGNRVPNKLFLNKGGLQFEDITKTAGVEGDDRWMTGVTMADVNADGWLDIYVSVSGKFTTKKNLLYINQGLGEDGLLTFAEEAESYGIADEGSSTQGTFFDYDRDGDLDLYVANYPYTNFKTPNYSYRIFLDKKDPEKSDKLYRNNGDGQFDDVTAEAGLLNYGLSLSATAGDFNNDGWDDIYVSNDFATPDFFYFNNGDGTFKEQSKEVTQHTSFFGMGVDAGDINNDGLLDIVQMDMTPEDNRRNKANMASMDISRFWEIVGFDMHYQYMQNSLQLNNGIDDDGLPHFSDIARMAGLSSTDWSWASLMVDLDQDGWKDIFITNGTRKDINNKDYFNKIEDMTFQEKQETSQLELASNIPSEKVDNYVFRNNGDLTFDPVIEDWGLSHEGYSNGASYADLDNDGDLEIIISNIDEQAVIFENLSSQNNSNYLAIKLNGPEANPFGLGTKVWLKTQDGTQFHQHFLTRGFQSSVDPKLNFGLGKSTKIDELKVQWPDGRVQLLNNVDTNQELVLAYVNAQSTEVDVNDGETVKILKEVTNEIELDFQHQENSYDDYRYEVLLPHMYSRNGPGLAKGDVNGDGLEDFYVGGALGQVGSLYMQQADGTFTSRSDAFEEDKRSEDMGASFFDADGDSDLDLFVVSGGNEYSKGSKFYADRLYINDGSGTFEKDNSLPEVYNSGSKVRPQDMDGDGDMDLFIGGRIVPRSYPTPASSVILRNDSEAGGVKFTDVTEEVAPMLSDFGLVTDAVWADFDKDSRADLVVVGEWMPITFLRNGENGFENVTNEYGFEKTTGWWYSILAEDFDNDGDLDFVGGNLGLNYKYQANSEESFDVYANDYDKNGKLDIVLGYYDDGVQYPLRGRQCSSEQIPTIKYKYKDYNSFASATLIDVYTEDDLESSLHYQAWNFASSYIENKGEGNFEVRNLPNEVQLSSINDMLTHDFNGDGNLDLLVAGNLYTSEVETTRNDASYGHLLIGDGLGGFEPVSFVESGYFVNGDTREIALLNHKDGILILSAKNNDQLTAHLLSQ